MISLNYEVIDINHFPDHTLHLKAESKWSGGGAHKITWDFENNEELVALIFLVKHLRDHDRDCKIELIMPYISNARMDRVKHSDEVFTLKYFCEVINSLNFSKVSVLDAHSNVSLALLNNVKQIDVKDYICRAAVKVHADCGNIPVCYFPDEGAMKRYSEFAEGAYSFGVKKRDWESGQIQGIQIQNEEAIKGKDVLIIDDICSKGGTFYYSAKALKEAGAANIYLYVSHLEEAVFLGDLWASMTGPEPLVKCIYTADPLFVLPSDAPNSLIRMV